MDAAYDLARFIVNQRFEDLPAEVVERAKRAVLDTLGVTVAASTMGESCTEIVELLKESGATGQSTVVGYGGRLPSWMAAFANGAMVHQLDYDDGGPGAHPSGCIIPAAFAMAEEVGGISGKELIVAVALATDIKGRMSSAGSRSLGSRGDGTGGSSFMGSPLVGYYSATVAAGRIAGLDVEQMVDAFSHTLQQASSTNQMIYGTGGAFRGIRDAFPNKGGVLSVLMTKKGLKGTKDPLEGRGGFYDAYYRGIGDRKHLVENLGVTWENLKVYFKPWPASAVCAAPIDSTLTLIRENNLAPDDIDELIVWIGPSDQSRTGNTQVENIRSQIADLDYRRHPQTSIDAKFSVPFNLGVAALHKTVTVRDFTPEGLADPAVAAMADRVTLRESEDMRDVPHQPRIEIKTKDGRSLSYAAAIVYGSAANPMAKPDLDAKFRDCVSFSAKPIPPADVERAIKLIDNLEQVEDVSEVIRLLG